LIVSEHSIAGLHGGIPVRQYRTAEGSLPVLVWMHGGGFAGGDLDMNEAHLVATELAARAPAIVVSVDYRLAGNGVHYPVPLDDVHAVWRWASDGRCGSGPVAIGGASAGANLAAASVLRSLAEAEPVPAALLLAYPVVHFPVPAQPIDSFPPDALRFSAEDIEGMFFNYVGRVSNLPLEAVPGFAELSAFPPTTVIISEFDELRPSAELFVRQLDESGVPVARYLAPGMVHGHLNSTLDIPEVGRSLDVFVEALRRCL
jgi:acetyl esterase